MKLLLQSVTARGTILLLLASLVRGMTLQASQAVAVLGMTTAHLQVHVAQAGIQAQAVLARQAGTVALAQATVHLQVHQAGINYVSRCIVWCVSNNVFSIYLECYLLCL